MKLDALAPTDEMLVYLERYVDEGAKNYSPLAAKTDAAPQFQPQGDCQSFDLVTVWAPKDRVTIYQADPTKYLAEYYVQPDRVRFAVHPETWVTNGIEHMEELHILPRAEAIKVAPTASTRTVLTLGQSHVPPHFIKLHYPRRISRFNRRLRRKNIHDSVSVSSDLTEVHFDKFAYLPDTLGFTFGDSETAWGFLMRERIPRPFQGTRTLIPCFALYGGDLQHPEDPPLLVQMIERLGADPQSFILNEIMIPVVECWAKVARERGILLESHAQNTLLEVDHNFRPRRVVHRDFDVWIDYEARRRNGLPVPFLGAHDNSHTGPPIEQHYSLIYDRFIGHEFFDYLLGILKRFYTADEEAVRNRVRQAFHRAFPEADRCFPATMFYFSNEPQAGNHFALVDMKQKPEWR